MVGRRSNVPRRSSTPGSSPSAPSANDARVIVPKLNVDPIWSLRPWPVVLHVGGEDFEIPAMPATDWLVYLMQPEPDLDGLLGDWMPDIEDLLLDEVVDLEELYELVLELISTVSARPWYVALRLIQVARGSWDVLHPELIRRRVDPDRHSLAAWLDVLLVAILHAMDPKDTTMFTLKLEAKPQSESIPTEEMEMDRGAFMAMGMN